METDKALKKLVGEEKINYLKNLNSAVGKYSSQTFPYFHTIPHLVHILTEPDYVEVDTSNGFPSTTSMLGIANMSKDIKKEFQDLKSRMSSGNKEDEEKSLEQMIVERIKSKIYSFDTLAAEEFKTEGTPYCDLINTELTLRNKLYLLKTIENRPLSLDTSLVSNLGSSGNQAYSGVLQFTGFDPRENKFVDYKIDIMFYYRKKIIDSESREDIKPKYKEILKKQFSIGNIDSMYKALADIKHLWVAKITRSTLGPFCDKNTGEIPGIKLPENLFKNHPDAYVLNVSTETIDTSMELPESFKRTNTAQAKKINMVYRVVPQDISDKMVDFYKGDGSIKVVM